MFTTILICLFLSLIFSFSNYYFFNKGFKNGKEKGWKEGVNDTFNFFEELIEEDNFNE